MRIPITLIISVSMLTLMGIAALGDETTLEEGDDVQIYLPSVKGLKVRDSPSKEGNDFGLIGPGIHGKITSEPIVCKEGITWRHVDWGFVSGYSAERGKDETYLVPAEPPEKQTCESSGGRCEWWPCGDGFAPAGRLSCGSGSPWDLGNIKVCCVESSGNSPTLSDSDKFSKNEKVVTNYDPGVNIRKGAGLKMEKILGLKKGTEVEIIDDESYFKDGYNWWIVRADMSGQTIIGWMAGEFLEKKPEASEQEDTACQEACDEGSFLFIFNPCNREKCERNKGCIFDDNRCRKKTIDDIIEFASDKYDMPAELIKSMIRRESSFKERSVSKKGAQGLMQIMPETLKGLVKCHHRECTVDDPPEARYCKSMGMPDISDDVFDPENNIEGGTCYLSYLLKKDRDYKGNLELALAAYNYGPTDVRKIIREAGKEWSDVEPNVPSETATYVKKVLEVYNKYLA